MPRRPRVDFPGAWHHVMNRGAARAQIFFSDQDCLLFLDLLDDVVDKLGLEVLAYALMPNHFHLLVRSPGTVASAMQRLLGRFTQRRNIRTRSDGPVFRGRYRSQLVTNEEYLRYLTAYIHLNPVRARLASTASSAQWTSHRALTGLDSAPSWLALYLRDEFLGNSEQVSAFVREIHRGSREWPVDLDLEAGIIGSDTFRPSRGRRKSAAEQPLSAADVLSRVCSITGTGRLGMCLPVRGRGANAPTRFATWMLWRHTRLTYQEMADTLQTTPGWVAQVIHKARRSPCTRLQAWATAWANRER